MRTPFPTKPGRTSVGYPDPARPCACGDRQVTHHREGECVMCGRLPAHAIQTTFARRQATLARQPPPTRTRPRRDLTIRGRQAAHDLASLS